MKQTAVKWLIEQISNSSKSTIDNPNSIFQQAKEMEKEQIIEAANILLYHGPGPGNTAAEQYYNKTFNNKDFKQIIQQKTCK